MTRHNARCLMGAIALMLTATCAVQAQACCRRSADQGQGQTYLERLVPSVGDKAIPSVGEGEHTYRFVVRDARQPDRPWRRARYQVSTREGVKWEGGPDAHQGVTDAQGRTAVYRSKTPVEPQDWMVLPLLGKGQQGMTFRLVDQDENGVADHPYLIDAEGGAIFCGLSLPGGHTARVLGRNPTTMRLYTSTDEGECRKLAAALNPVMDQTDPQRQIKGLQRLLRHGWLPSSQERVRSKLMDVLLAHGSDSEIRALASSWLSEPGISRKALADRLNSAGYGLVDQKPPRLPKLAESLLSQALALDTTPAILDSHAWALHALGRHDQALSELDAAIEGFHQRCEPDDEGMYQETLTHRAQVLAVMGRREEVQRQQVEDPSSQPSCVETRDQRFLSGELAMPAAFR